MEDLEDNEDTKLVKLSADLLESLEDAVPKILRKSSVTGSNHGPVHRYVKRRDLEYLTNLIEPFQGEPQLLDARLKHILGPIVDGYLEYLRLEPKDAQTNNLDFQTAVCSILYVLCKVRGYKVVVGFFNNEPKHFDLVLSALERSVYDGKAHQTTWQVQYILLLWVSHLLLTPFDLHSICDKPTVSQPGLEESWAHNLPPLAQRIAAVGLVLLPSSAKAQDGAATMLVRLVNRPDMQKLRLGDALASNSLSRLQDPVSNMPLTTYEQLGPLRFVTGVASSSDLSHLAPSIYRVCENLARDDANAMFASNAVAKKLWIKVFRNIAILSLRSNPSEGPLASFLQTTSVLEEVIDHLLRAVRDRDTPVRYAAAKAISLIVLELDPVMGHEVIQAVLDTFKEDIPRSGHALDFRTANALKWHGLTLTLAHALFKCSASPDQLPDILNALIAALQFEQRTATGSSVGTNIRDAANFGIWSLSRRYTTRELLSVDADSPQMAGPTAISTVVQAMANQLILSACLDPSGNIRRGSSAALQELVGRHPDQVVAGIALVQIVDYQAVGLRSRAVVDVAGKAAQLHGVYYEALLEALLEWRGLGSADVLSREAAADSIARLALEDPSIVLQKLLQRISKCMAADSEDLHGLVLTLACVLERARQRPESAIRGLQKLWDVVDVLQIATKDWTARVLRSELPAACARFLAAICEAQIRAPGRNSVSSTVPLAAIDALTDRLMSRYEDTVLERVSQLVLALMSLKRKVAAPLGCIGAQTLGKRVGVDGSKSALNGAGRAIGLGVLSARYDMGLAGEKTAAAIAVLIALVDAMNVDWRVVGIRALQHAVDTIERGQIVDDRIAFSIVSAVHQGMNDYTIDERGDVGSLVRLQAIACTSSIFSQGSAFHDQNALKLLQADIFRLSLEKLDRVRLQAAQCRHQFFDLSTPVADLPAVSCLEFFYQALEPLSTPAASSAMHTALLQGCISCAGVSAEALLQASRAAVVDLLSRVDNDQLNTLLSHYSTTLGSMLQEGANMHPALELLAFLLDMQLPQRLSSNSTFKWRSLLSMVQKSHHKSNDIPRLLAAVHIYRGLTDVHAIRGEVLKKLMGMLNTNPYPRIRSTVAEVCFVVLGDERLKLRDWTKPIAENRDMVEELEQKCLAA